MAISHLPLRTRHLSFPSTTDDPSERETVTMNPVYSRGQPSSPQYLQSRPSAVYTGHRSDSPSVAHWQRQLCCEILKHSTIDVNVFFRLITENVSDPRRIFDHVPLPHGCDIQEARHIMAPILMPRQDQLDGRSYADMRQQQSHKPGLHPIESRVLPPMDITSHKRRSTETLQSPSIKKQALIPPVNNTQITLPSIHTMVERPSLTGPAPPPEMVRPELHHNTPNEIYSNHQRTPSSPRAHYHHHPAMPPRQNMMNPTFHRPTIETYPQHHYQPTHISGPGPTSTRSPTPVSTPMMYNPSGDIKSNLQTPTPALSPAIKPSPTNSASQKLLARQSLVELHSKQAPHSHLSPISPEEMELRPTRGTVEARHGNFEVIGVKSIDMPGPSSLPCRHDQRSPTLCILPPTPIDGTTTTWTETSVSPTNAPMEVHAQDAEKSIRRRRGRPRKEPGGLISVTPRIPRNLQPRPPAQELCPPPGAVHVGPRMNPGIVMPKSRRQSARGARSGGKIVETRMGSVVASGSGPKSLFPVPGDEEEGLREA